MTLRVVAVDLENEANSKAWLELLDHYARDPMGGGTGLSEYAKAHLVRELQALPNFHGALAWRGDEAVGLINCFAVEGGQVFQLADQIGLGVIGEPGAAAHRVACVVIEQFQPGSGICLVFEVDRNNLQRHSPRSCHMPSTRFFTSPSMTIGCPHSRLVSPGHLLVASSPILEPRPATGLAKSR